MQAARFGALFVALIMITVSGCSCGPKSSSVPSIATQEEARAVSKRARALSWAILSKFEKGQELTGGEKADLKTAARLWESRARFGQRVWVYPLFAGQCYLAIGDYEDAELCFREALAIPPPSGAGSGYALSIADVHVKLALTLEHMGKYEVAVKEAQIAVDAFPEEPSFLIALASSYIRIGSEGSLKGARRALEAALKADPKNSKALKLLGVLEAGPTKEKGSQIRH